MIPEHALRACGVKKTRPEGSNSSTRILAATKIPNQICKEFVLPIVSRVSRRGMLALLSFKNVNYIA